MQNQQPLNIFIVYAREDADALRELRTQFIPVARSKNLHVWYDGKILPGQHWDNEIKTQLQNSDIILLLISKHFFASEYIQTTELREALSRHESGKSVVIPVIVRPCVWQDAFEVSKFQALPEGVMPIYSSAWRDPEEAMVNVVESVKRVVKNLQEKRKTIHLKIPKQEQKPPMRYWDLQRIKFGLFLLGAIVLVTSIVYFAKHPPQLLFFHTTAKPNEQGINSDKNLDQGWHDDVVQVISNTSKGISKGSGFFVSNDGYILTLFGAGFEENGEYHILNSKGIKFKAKLISHKLSKGFEFVLFQIPASNTPYIKIFPLKEPKINMSIKIIGVEGDSSTWTIYAARVISADRDRIIYERPEESWLGMMGAPIVDIQDEVALGVHMGKSIPYGDTKTAQGILFEKPLLDYLFSKK